MAQTTGGISARDAKLEGSANGSSWTDFSGFANTVETEDVERDVGEAHTFDGDVPVVRGGKRKATKIKVMVVYTEGVSDAWPTIRAAFEAGTDYYLRISPKGGQTGESQFTSAAGVISKLIYPKLEAGPGAVVLAGFELVVPSLSHAAAA